MDKFLKDLTRTLLRLVDPLIDSILQLPDEKAIKELVSQSGFDSNNIDYQQLESISHHVQDLKDLLNEGNATSEIVDSAGQLIQKIITINFNSLRTNGSGIDLSDLGKKLLETLVAKYLATYQSHISAVLEIFEIYQYQNEKHKLYLERLSSVFEPHKSLSAIYLKDDHLDVDLLVNRLSSIFRALGFNPYLDEVSEDSIFYNSDSEFALTCSFFRNIKFQIIPYSNGESNHGIILLPIFPELADSFEVNKNLIVDYLLLQPDFGFFIDKTGIRIQSALDSQPEANISIRIVNPESRPIIGSKEGTNLNFHEVCIRFANSDGNFDATLKVTGGAINISGGDGDGFVQKILPREPIQVSFDLILGYNVQRGFYVDGAAGFKYQFQINKQYGPIFIHTVDLSVLASVEGINIITAVSGGAEIGPVTAVVQEIGLKTNVIFGKPGLLGKADLEFGFKPPSAIGLSIQTSGLSGSGFLLIDPPNYAGMLQIAYQDMFDITAFALITTKLPEGDGYSMVIQIMAKFTPVQLGFGFALVGVGGIFGFHRDLNIEALKTVVKNHSLDKLLFPENPVSDALVIIDAIQSIYPVKKDSHVIGFMGAFIWGGTIKIVEFNIGIVLPLRGGPVLIVILGTAKCKLPTEENALLKLKMDVFGVIDFGNETIAIDLELYDSKLQQIDLTGQMALRACWAKNGRNFAMSAGGWYPRFRHIPENFPSLRRMTASMEKSGFKLALKTYFAVTTNTIQTGANFELWGKKSGFTITGDAGFDAIFIFRPFSFEILIYFRVRIEKGPIGVGVQLEFKLVGPNPYKASGYAKFDVMFKTFKVRFEKTFGDAQPDHLPVISPKQRLIEELSNKKCIRFDLPEWASSSFTFAEGAEDKLDPDADIIISQSVVPLNYNMQRFGGGKPPESEKKLVMDVGVGVGEDFKEAFAVEQFNSWSKDEKLSAPPFEDLNGGKRCTGEFVTYQPTQPWPQRTIEFETVLRESDEYPGDQTRKYKSIRSRLSIAEHQRHLLSDWSKFGNQLYHRSRSVSRQENYPGFIDLGTESYSVSTQNSLDGKFQMHTVNGLPVGQMTFTQAMQLMGNSEDLVILNVAETV